MIRKWIENVYKILEFALEAAYDFSIAIAILSGVMYLTELTGLPPQHILPQWFQYLWLVTPFALGHITIKYLKKAMVSWGVIKEER
jgi:hypothetical protein